jgi:hypothetical protein
VTDADDEDDEAADELAVVPPVTVAADALLAMMPFKSEEAFAIWP